ncbi:MAG: nitroreductase family protein [Moraxellaceae bacterium]|nr:nitroreductase family protein [Moraxellaceae bacterium]
MNDEILADLLEHARWAPSGDNTQPWRFQILAPDHIVVHGHDTREDILYDFHGHPSHLAHGALLETLRIAATRHQLLAIWQRRPESSETRPLYDVWLKRDESLNPDPLHASIKTRAVQRRPMSLQKLTASQVERLAATLPEGWQVRFMSPFRERLWMARLSFLNAGIRLRCPEAYPVHKSIIEWRARFSEDRIPEEAVGVDPMTARLMQWVMASWDRVSFFNRYLMGTLAPRIQLDLIPAIACSAHVQLVAPTPLRDIDDHVAAGVAVQRFWLACEKEGLRLQPNMTPLIFSWYVGANEAFTRSPEEWRAAQALRAQLANRLGEDALQHTAFLARIGFSRPARSRSLRLALARLMWSGKDAETTHPEA